MHGTNYLRQECYILLRKNGEGLPQFVKIVSVFPKSFLDLFKVLPVITHHFDDNLYAYNATINVSSSHNIIYIQQEKLLIADALQTFTLQMKTYIKIRHDISDM